jgi:hypothetical protein
VDILFLKKNICVEADNPDSVHFAQWLLNVGHGKDLPVDYILQIPQYMLCGPDLSHLISQIYPNIQMGAQFQDQYFLECAILCPRNSEVNEIYSKIYSQFPMQGQIYHSADSAKGYNQEEADLYPVDYLNSLNFGGIPLSKLELKYSVPLMLLYNLDPGMALCNGTRLCLIRKTGSCLEVCILTGLSAGKLALIPLVNITSKANQLPFEFERR